MSTKREATREPTSEREETVTVGNRSKKGTAAQEPGKGTPPPLHQTRKGGSPGAVAGGPCTMALRRPVVGAGSAPVVADATAVGRHAGTGVVGRRRRRTAASSGRFSVLDSFHLETSRGGWVCVCVCVCFAKLLASLRRKRKRAARITTQDGATPPLGKHRNLRSNNAHDLPRWRYTSQHGADPVQFPSFSITAKR